MLILRFGNISTTIRENTAKALNSENGGIINMRAVITVIGKDMVGILAKISTECCNHNINVLEVTQSILQDMFAMIMMVDISKSDIPFTEFSDMLNKIGGDMGLSIHAMHEDIFNAMHTI